MASKTSQPGLWESLPKPEQEKLRKQMMAQPEPQQGKRQQNGRSSFALKGYLRCELSSADKDAFRQWEAAQADLGWMDGLVKEVDSGYLLKIGESGNGFQASLCAATTGAAWDGYVLTAHASTGARAAMLLVFKHAVLMARDWTAWLTDEGEDFFR